MKLLIKHKNTYILYVAYKINVVVASLLVLCGFPFYLWFSKEEKGCANYTAVAVVDNSLIREGKFSWRHSSEALNLKSNRGQKLAFRIK